MKAEEEERMKMELDRLQKFPTGILKNKTNVLIVLTENGVNDENDVGSRCQR